MIRSRNLIVQFCVATILLVGSSQLNAQRPPRKSLAVDEVTRTSGKRMYGIVLDQNPQTGVQLMVDRTWFSQTYSKLYAAHVQAEVKTEIEAYTDQLFRLESWWKSRVDDLRLVEFADEEMERIENLRAERKTKGVVDLKPFTVVLFSANEIHDVFRQSPANQKIAGLAWHHELKRVSSRPATALRRELKNRNVDIDNSTFDLSSKLSANRRQSEREWNARKAILEFRFRDNQLQFQGVDSNLIRVDSNKPAGEADMQALMGQFMGSGLGNQGQVNSLLAELGMAQPEQKTKWWAKASKIAKSEGFSGFAAKRLLQDFSTSTVKVEYCFLAETSDDRWEQIVTVTGSASRDDVDTAVMARLKDDPQVSRVLSVVEGLGIHSGDAIDQALRQGAATEAAMNDAQGKFDELIERYGRKSDSPILKF